MNERDWVDRFSRDVDSLLNEAGRTDSEPTPTEYRQALDLAHTLATTDFSAESQVQQALRRRLLNRIGAREGWRQRKEYVMRTFFRKRHPAVTLAAIFLTVLALALLPPVQGWAQEGISRFIEVVITPLISPYQAQSPPAEIPLEFTTLQEAQRQRDFHIYQPACLPPGVKPVGALASGVTSVLLRYEGQGPMRTRLDLAQSRALPEGPNITLGIPDQAWVHSTTVNGVEALWLEAPFGPRSVALLCWEKDGFVFSLRVSARTPGLSIEEAVKIAESLK